MVNKKRLAIKNKALKKKLKEGEGNDIKKDFFELLKRASKPIKKN